MKIDLDKIKKEKPIEDLIRFGIINIDKPNGPTSFSVSDYVRRSLCINKTSHAGTLDPIVSGVLPIMLGRACRLSDYLMHRDKKYVGIMRLHEDIPDIRLDEVIKKFIGKIKQLPPVRSRVKRAERVREIKTFKILERNGKDVLFETEVQAGTYIRKLCDDIGKETGGAHMLELRRTKAGMFDEKESKNMYDFEEAVKELNAGNENKLRSMIIHAEVIGSVLGVVELKPEYIRKYHTGSPLFRHFLKNKTTLPEGENIACFAEGRFIGCYKIVNEEEVWAVPEFIFN